MKTKSIYCFFEPVVLLFKKSRSEFSEQEKNALKVAPFSKGRACPPPVWFRSLLNYTLCVLLAFSPVYSFPQPPPIEGPKGRANIATPATSATTQNFLNGMGREFLESQISTLEEFNKKVETLGDHIFGVRVDSGQHYKDHPLDTYSLIGQKVEMQKAGFWERHNPWHKETKTLFNKLKPSERRKAKEQTQEGLGESIISVFDVGNGFNQAEQEKLEKEKPSASESEHTPRPFFTEIKPKNLVVNIVLSESQTTSTDSKEETSSLKSQEIVVGRINSQGDKINSLAYGPKVPANFDSPLHVAKGGSYHKDPVNMPHYTGKSFVIPQNSQELYNFNISYQGQVLHRFSNNIQWISFVGPYLVFMEPSRVYKNKAELSFIDLSYFHSAIGKTALPVFRIPLVLKSKAKKESLLNPLEISITKENLTLRSSGEITHEISLSYIDETIRARQIQFNTLVSMLRVDAKYSRDMLPFFKDIAQHFEKMLKEQQTTRQTTSAHPNQSKNIRRQVLAEVLHNRVDLGAPSDHFGHYGAVKASQHRMQSVVEQRETLLKAITHSEEALQNGIELDPETEKLLRENRQKLANLNISDLDVETYKKSADILKQDTQFQQTINQVSDSKFGKRAVMDRIKSLLVYVTLPQPLGAPKIQKALGLMANTVRKGETVEDRFIYLTEGLKQLSANPKARFVGIPVLAGMASMAAPEVANFFSSIFNSFTNSVDSFSSISNEYVSKRLPDFFNPFVWSKAYVEDGNIGPFAKGITAFFSAMVLFYYVLFHLPVNIKKLVDYLKTEKAKNHNEQVLTFIKKLPNYFKNYNKIEAKNYYQNLAIGEFKNIGLPVKIYLKDGSHIPLALKTFENVHSIFNDLKNKDFHINLEFKIHGGDEVVRFSSVDGRDKVADIKWEMSLQPGEMATRSFFLQKGYFSDLIKEGELIDNVSLEMTGERVGTKQTAFLYKVELQRLGFTSEEMLALGRVLTGTKYEKLYDQYMIDPIMKKAEEDIEERRTFAKNTQHLSDTQLSMLESVYMFLFSLHSLNSTQEFLVPTWNTWFFIRSVLFTIFYPHRLATMLLFSNYFSRAYDYAHRATALNGGFRLRFTEFVQNKYPSGREYLSALKKAETQIIQVEKNYWRAATELTYLQALSEAFKEDNKTLDLLLNRGVQKQQGDFDFLPKDDLNDKSSLKLALRDGRVSEVYQNIMSLSDGGAEKVDRKTSLFLEMFQNKVFEEGIQSYMKEQLGIDPSASKREVLKQIRKKTKDGEPINLRAESLDEIRSRVLRVSTEKNIAQKMKENMASWHKAFLEKLKVQHNRQMENMLNPRKSGQMERYYVADTLRKDPEAMAKATRFAIVNLLVNYPISITFIFMLLAGVSEGIVKVLYSEPFNERAIFHLSSYILWVEVFALAYIIDVMGSAWFKLQVDASSHFAGAFDKFPTKEELNKRFSALRYFWQRGVGKRDREGNIDQGKMENTFVESYKMNMRLLVSNFPAALPTFALGYFLLLGRFDIEIFLGGYLLLSLFGHDGWVMKTERVYELASNYAGRDLIRKGIDIKKFAHHPMVQKILLDKGFVDRIKYNIVQAMILIKPIELSAVIMENAGARDGVRAMHRVFLPEGHVWTEYWEKMLEGTKKIFWTAGDLCKKAFTNRRLDMVE